MNGIFPDRTYAGRLLAPWLRSFAAQLDVIVLGLPRGGVPVAAEIARELGVPCDALVVRKVGVPGHEEIAMGAVATGGVTVRNASAMDAFSVTADEFELVATRERAELARRERACRGDRPPPDLRGRRVVLVDDGVATGSTMLAAVQAARAAGASAVIVAAPVMAREAMDELQRHADEVFTVLAPETFCAVGEFYEDFRPVAETEVRTLLATAGRPLPPAHRQPEGVP